MMDSYKNEMSRIHAPETLVRDTMEMMHRENDRLALQGSGRNTSDIQSTRVRKWMTYAVAAAFMVVVCSATLIFVILGNSHARSVQSEKKPVGLSAPIYLNTNRLFIFTTCVEGSVDKGTEQLRNIVIATYSQQNNTLQLDCFAPDYLVDLNEQTTLLQCYEEGGPERIIQVLHGKPEEQYLTIDSTSTQILIDFIGGVTDVNLSLEDALYINHRCAGVIEDAHGDRFSILKKQGKKSLDERDGIVTLNGEQFIYFIQCLSQKTPIESVNAQGYKRFYEAVIRWITKSDISAAEYLYDATNIQLTNLTVSQLVDFCRLLRDSNPDIVWTQN